MENKKVIKYVTVALGTVALALFLIYAGKYASRIERENAEKRKEERLQEQKDIIEFKHYIDQDYEHDDDD